MIWRRVTCSRQSRTSSALKAFQGGPCRMLFQGRQYMCKRLWHTPKTSRKFAGERKFGLWCYVPVPSPRVFFGGLSPPNWNMKHDKLVEFLSNFYVKLPVHESKALPHKRKVPILKPFWRRFCYVQDENRTGYPIALVQLSSFELGLYFLCPAHNLVNLSTWPNERDWLRPNTPCATVLII